MSGDPYVYPGTDVLINKENIRDQGQLEAFERIVTANRMEHLPADIPLTPDGYRRLHRHIFEPVYAWAGQDRTIELARGSSRFCRPEFIGSELRRRFAAIRADKGLRGLAREQFAARAAEHVSELNAIHPFRDGNGRTLRAFLEVLAAGAGHRIDLARIRPDAWNDASIVGFMHGDQEPMQRVILGAIATPGDEPEPAGRQTRGRGRTR